MILILSDQILPTGMMVIVHFIPTPKLETHLEFNHMRKSMSVFPLHDLQITMTLYITNIMNLTDSKAQVCFLSGKIPENYHIIRNNSYYYETKCSFDVNVINQLTCK